MLETLFIQIIIPVAGTFEEVVIVQLDICLVLFRYILLRENGFGWADRHAGAAVNTSIGIYPKISAPLGIVFRTGNNAIYRADFYAVPFARAEASNNMSH
jgi:hypothetical protein